MDTLPRSPIDLPPLLRAGAAGARHIEAAVGLLIADGYWLDHAGFRDRCVIHMSELDPEVAGVDWPACREVPVFPHEIPNLALLLVAVELAGYSSGQNLADLLTWVSQDDRAAEHVIEAIAHTLSFEVRHDDEHQADGDGGACS